MRLTCAAGVWRRMGLVFREQLYSLFGPAFCLRPLRQRAEFLRVSAGAASFFYANWHFSCDTAMWRIPSEDGNRQRASSFGMGWAGRVFAVLTWIGIGARLHFGDDLRIKALVWTCRNSYRPRSRCLVYSAAAAASKRREHAARSCWRAPGCTTMPSLHELIISQRARQASKIVNH